MHFATDSSLSSLSAYIALNPALQSTVRSLLAILDSPESSEPERTLARGTIGEILFPSPQASDLQSELEATLDREEDVFAFRLILLMSKQNFTQAELAAKTGVSQPAISQMLNRRCRPQMRTVKRIAEALGVEVEELWAEK